MDRKQIDIKMYMEYYITVKDSKEKSMNWLEQKLYYHRNLFLFLLLPSFQISEILFLR